MPQSTELNLRILEKITSRLRMSLLILTHRMPLANYCGKYCNTSNIKRKEVVNKSYYYYLVHYLPNKNYLINELDYVN